MLERLQYARIFQKNAHFACACAFFLVPLQPILKHYLSILFFLLLLVACDPAAELGMPFHKGQEVVSASALY
jgi:hypothetical protein